MKNDLTYVFLPILIVSLMTACAPAEDTTDITEDAPETTLEENTLPSLDDPPPSSIDDSPAPPTMLPPALQVDDWKTYRNEEFDFEFKYPSHWTMEESDQILADGSGMLARFSYEIDNEIVYPVGGEIFVRLSVYNISEDILNRTGQEQEMPFDQWFNTYYRQQETLNKAEADNVIEEVAVEEVLVDGRPAYVQTYEFSRLMEGRPPIIKEAFIDIGEEKAFVIQATAPLPEGRQIIEIFDELLAGLNFMEN